MLLLHMSSLLIVFECPRRPIAAVALKIFNNKKVIAFSVMVG